VYALVLTDGQPRVRAVFSDQQIRQQAALTAIVSVHADTGAALWLGCGQSLCQSGLRGVTQWGPGQGVPADEWRAIMRDHSGQLWARGNRHIIALPPRAERFVDHTPPPDLLHKVGLQVQLVEDEQGRILSSSDNGLIRWDGRRWEQFGPANGLRSAGGLNALLFDRSGGLWLGARGLGLINWLGYGNWENWSKAQGLPDDVVLSFVRDRAGVLHLGSRAGPGRLLPRMRHFLPDHSTHVWSSLTLDSRGRVWGATYSGWLMLHDGVSGATVQVARMPLISRMLADRQDRIWLATKSGIYMLDASRDGQPVSQSAGLKAMADTAGVSYRGICEGPRGELWFLAEHRLLKLDGTRWDSFAVGSVGDGADMDSLSCAADGTLWLGSSQAGLWHAAIHAGGMQLTRLDQPLLGGTIIFGVHEDRRGWLWVGTDSGIAIWNRQHWRFFNQSDGLIWNDTNGNVFYEDDDGSMWIATSNGASHLRRPELLFAPQTLSAQIESASRAGQPLAPEQPWQLPWSAAPLQLTLASLHFSNRGALRFHYRLSGLESLWSVSATPELRYAALPPGEYQFEYYVSNAYSHSVSQLQRHAVTILPPWWKTVPFYLLCAVLFGLALSTLHRLRVRQLIRRQQHTERQVRERTHELEQSREQLRVRALMDGLTMTWNRSAILEIIGRELEQANRQQTPLLLILLDLDHFKRINDNHGHAAGDAVLKEVVRRLCAMVRQTDAVGRYGGEEFLVVLPGLDQASGQARVEELHHVIRREPIHISEQQSINVTGSFGVIAFEPCRPLTLTELIAQADLALYRSKEHGRDRVEYVIAEQ
jgi:diguanylate cyclase (GGDEF)-like protein